MSANRDDTLKVDATGQPYIEVRGVKVEVRSEGECAHADYVVCGPRSYFADDIWTSCSRCASPICHRPYIPTTPPKICVSCMTALLRGK